MYIWPLCLFPAKEVRWTLRGVAINGGISTAGFPARSRTDGGGYWTCEMSGIWLRTPEQIRSARAWEAILDGGFTQVIVPTYEPQFAPRPPGLTLPPPVTHGGGAPFDDGTGYVGGVIEAETAEAAPLRATTLKVRMIVGSALLGGETFGLIHPTRGARRYTVGRVLEVEGDVTTIEFRPPLREATEAGFPINFNDPGCVMRQGDFEDFIGALQSGRFADMKASFSEAF